MRILCLALLVALSHNVFAQIGVSDTVITSIDSSAMLDVQGTKRGTLLSRMTTEQRLAIPKPAEGLLVYDLTKHKFFAYTGKNWRALMFETDSFASQTFNNPSLLSGGEFGHAVSVWKDYIAVGAPKETVNNKSQQGAVTLFKKSESGFVFNATLYAPDGQAGDLFGYSLQITDTTLMVGSILDDVGENINQGSVYVYGLVNGTWTYKYKLTGSNGAAGDEFGNTLHINNEKLIVGAHLDDYATSSNQGSVYYFALHDNVWTEKQKIFATDGSAGDEFGSDVFIGENFLAVSSYKDDTLNLTDIGSAYIYKLDSELGMWEKVNKTFPVDGKSYDLFGFSLVISGNSLIVGAPYQDYPGSNKDRGAVYTYTIQSDGQLTYTQKLVPSDNSINDYYGDYFGSSLAVNGQDILIGSHFEDPSVSGIDRGGVYHYILDGGQLIYKQFYTEPDLQYEDIYGFSVALDATTIVIGAPYKNIKKGVVYIKSRDN